MTTQLSAIAATSAEVSKFVEQADYYRKLKEQTNHLPTRHLLEQMEESYRILARTQEQLDRLSESNGDGQLAAAGA